MPALRTHYEVLGVSSKATADEIKKAYRQLLLKNHPDKNNQSEESIKRATVNTQRINEAYEVLRDEQARRQYDVQLAEGWQDEPMQDQQEAAAFDPQREEELRREHDLRNEEAKRAQDAQREAYRQQMKQDQQREEALRREHLQQQEEVMRDIDAQRAEQIQRRREQQIHNRMRFERDIPMASMAMGLGMGLFARRVFVGFAEREEQMQRPLFLRPNDIFRPFVLNVNLNEAKPHIHRVFTIHGINEASMKFNPVRRSFMVQTSPFLADLLIQSMLLQQMIRPIHLKLRDEMEEQQNSFMLPRMGRVR